MSALIINADDLGASPAVNRAIADLHEAGLVTSASLIVNLPHSAAAAELAREMPRLSVGVHLNLTKGRPLLPSRHVPSLVDEQGQFYPSPEFYRRAVLGQINWHEAAAELEAQVEWALAQGLTVDNLDTHVHFHLLPAGRRLTLELARRYGIPAWRSPNVLHTLFPNRAWNDLLARPPERTELASPDYLLSLHHWGERLLTDPRVARLLSQPNVVTELVVHPGYAPDPDLPLPDQLPPDYRQEEVNLVRSPAFRAWLERLGCRLITFADL